MANLLSDAQATHSLTNRLSTRSSGVVGERIRERRRELGLSLQALAERAGLTASFLSLVEREQNSPSLESLRRIAEALDVPIFYFTEQFDNPNPVVRRDERIKITFPPGDVTCELLVPLLRNRLEVFISRAYATAGNIARTPKRDSEECIYVIAGKLRVVLSDEEYVLEKDDSIYFHGGSLRQICALGEEEAVFLCAITPPVL
jgi:transcriptional regulator with XRE-family HTH domain